MNHHTSKNEVIPPEKKTQKISIRVAFTILTALVLSLSGLFTIILSYQGSRFSIINVTGRLMSEVSTNVSAQTQNHFNSSLNALKNFENGIHNRNLSKKNLEPEVILDFLFSIAKTRQGLSAISFGEASTGNLYTANRMPDGTISKRTITQTKKATTVRWEHITPKYYSEHFPREKVFAVEESYDPREYPWYKKALTTDDFVWTDPYIFHSDEHIEDFDSDVIHPEDGVEISVAKKLFRNKDKQNKDFLGVMSVDFDLSALSTFLQEIDILSGENDLLPLTVEAEERDHYIFLMNEELSLLATSDKNTPPFKIYTGENHDEHYELYTIENVPNKLVTTSFNEIKAYTESSFTSINLFGIFRVFLQALTPNNQKKSDSTALEVVNFNFVDEAYLTTLSEFSPSPGMSFQIGIIFRENLVTSTVTQTLNLILLISAILVIIIIMINLRILRNVTNPIIDLARDMEKVKTFEIDVDSPVNEKQNFLREINDMNAAYNSMKSGLNSFKKFVPSEVVAKLVKLGKEARVGGEKLDISVFFSDITKFTVISEKTPSEKLIAQLRHYFNILSNGISEKNGTLDKYIGDSIMAFWGAPAADKDHAFNACSAAIHCQKLSKKINKNFEKSGLLPMNTRIGIHTGPAIVGNIGSDVRLNYTAIGDNVNLASRLEGLNKLYNTKIIISEKTYEAVRETFLSRLLDKVAVYGKKNSVAAYELIGFRDDVSQQDKEFYKLFDKGSQLYFSKRWEEAIRVFSSCLAQRESDGPSRVLLDRCLYYSENSLNMEEWNGVFTLVNK